MESNNEPEGFDFEQIMEAVEECEAFFQEKFSGDECLISTIMTVLQSSYIFNITEGKYAKALKRHNDFIEWLLKDRLAFEKKEKQSRQDASQNSALNKD